MLSFLSNFCKVVTSLSLYSFRRRNYQNFKFSVLKNLHLEIPAFGDGNEWSDFVMSNRTIESLSCKRFYSWNFYENDIDSRETLGPKLKMVCGALSILKHLKLYENMKVSMS